MEPDVIRLYSSSPPPMEDGAEDEDDEFGAFDGFSGVPGSASFSDFDTPTTFDQSRALAATSPPDVHNGPKANGVGPLGSGPSERTVSSSPDCNGRDTEVLTNGFVTFDLQGSPPACCHIKGPSAEDPGAPEGHFADFASFCSSEGPSETDNLPQTGETERRGAPEDAVRDRADAEAPAGSCNTDRGPQRDGATPEPSDSVCTEDGLSLNGDARDGAPETPGDFGAPKTPGDFGAPETTRDRDPGDPEMVEDADARAPETPGDGYAEAQETVGDTNVGDGAPETTRDRDPGDPETPGDAGAPETTRDVDPETAGDTDGEAGPSDEKSSETSLGRLLSTDALEELGDVSTPGSVPSPPLPGATPPEEDFGDFGGAAFGEPGFADFERPPVQEEPDPPPGSDAAAEPDREQDDDFGDFNSPRRLSGGRQADFPPSDSFGNFSAAEDSGWSAFGEQQQAGEGEEAWAAFGSAPSTDGAEREGPSPGAEDTGGTGTQAVALSSRLQTLFLGCFPADAPPTRQEDPVLTLPVLLEPGGERPAPQERSGWSRAAPGGVWAALQDVHDAVGLRYQWGGSHCNKVLLCCLGIDTRNILFTGQKKQPVIVPMYAAGLGMLEPTKEPVKPVSAAEMIASIAQTPPAAAEKNCQPDPVQEALPPVQFDWSSSGLTNPLDASAGSALLNLDFFGPVEDSGSGSSASMPGVDPELFELTTAKLDPSGAGSRVADAFARLMSTMEKTSTSTRKPRKDENLSEEASKVIAALPDLSFMQAKVLMFPATLTPLCSQATPD